MMNFLPRSRASAKQKGVAAIEFAIVLPLLVLIFTGMVEYGRLMWHYDALAKATRDAARFLSMEKAAYPSAEKITTAAETAAKNMVDDAAAAAGVKDLVVSNVTVLCENDTPATIDCATGAVSRVTVSVNYPFVIGGWVPVFGAANQSVSLSPHTTMPYMK